MIKLAVIFAIVVCLNAEPRKYIETDDVILTNRAGKSAESVVEVTTPISSHYQKFKVMHKFDL